MTPEAMLSMTPEEVLRDILAKPGLTGAHLLSWADNVDALGQYLDTANDPAAATDLHALAAAMREAAPRFPDPPLVPANAVEGG